MLLCGFAAPQLGGCGRAERQVTDAPSNEGAALELEADYRWAVTEGPKALQSAGYKVRSTEERTPTQTVFIGKVGASMQSWGHHARLTVEKLDGTKIVLRIRTVKHIKANVTEQDGVIAAKVLDYYKAAAAANQTGTDEELF